MRINAKSSFSQNMPLLILAYIMINFDNEMVTREFPFSMEEIVSGKLRIISDYFRILLVDLGVKVDNLL